MKKIALVFVVAFLVIPLTRASAQMMYGVSSSTTTINAQSLDAEEAAGQAIAQKLQTKAVACADLSQTDYESLGDYYMGLMMGNSHDSMEQNIEKSYGADYLKSMHIAMGERFSGCNVNVAFPAGMMGFGPMMGNWGPNSYQSSQSNWQGRGYSMMGWGFPGMMGGYGYSIGGTAFMVILWILAIVGLVAIIKWVISINNSKK